MSPRSSLADKLLRLMGTRDYQPLTENELWRKLKIPRSRMEELRAVLSDLEESGKVVRVRKNKWVIPSDADLVIGVIEFNAKGFAFLVPEEEGEDLFIPGENTGVAMHQDTVVARVESSTYRGRSKSPSKRQGSIIRIIKRRHRQIVGTIEKTGLFHYVVPDDPRFVHDIYIPDPKKSKENKVKAAVGDKVVVELLEWDSRHTNPEGILVERLGRTGEPGVDIISIIRKHGLPMEFPSEALAEVASYPPPGSSVDLLEERLDLTNEFIITIDPDTAKDFDDAISYKKLRGGNWEVGVHIADVSHYVKPGSALDKEARRRGNSVYLVNQVIPMLPEELSNGLCSLRPHVNRYAFSAFMQVTPEGELIKAKFARTVIHSKHRLTYKEAFERLQRRPKDELDTFLHGAWDIASALRMRRFDEGSLELDFPEIKVYCDPQGVPEKMVKIENDISHQLIEEYMLLANEAVALKLKNKHIPAIYRVHEAPDDEKLAEYRETLKAYGIKAGDLTIRRELQKAMKAINKRPERYSLKVELLKSLKRAMYDPRPLGHYGLAKVNYTHFTSPIRRYSDLVVHRALERGMIRGKKLPPMPDLPKTAKHLSVTERTAADAENETVNLKKIEFFQIQMASKARQQFQAQIMSVANYGMFVELPDFLISGLVHISSLKGDFYKFDPRRMQLVGRAYGGKYRVGDEVTVEVDRIDMFKKQIDFRIV